jgi:hypothetical protein
LFFDGLANLWLLVFGIDYGCILGFICRGLIA